MFNVIVKKLMVGAVASVMLFGASNAMAEIRYLVVGLETASGTVEQTKDFCMPQLVDLQTAGFEYVEQERLEPKLMAYFLQKPATGDTPADAATLFCFANIFEEQSGLRD